MSETRVEYRTPREIAPLPNMADAVAELVRRITELEDENSALRYRIGRLEKWAAEEERRGKP